MNWFFRVYGLYCCLVMACNIVAAQSAQADVVKKNGYDVIVVPAKKDAHGLTVEPAKEYHTGLRKDRKSIKDLAPTARLPLTLEDCKDMPAHFDLRELKEPKLGVSPFDGINNQGSAGTCWAHNLSHAFYSFNVVSGVSADKLSRQELTACDSQNYGVEGGNCYPDNGYQITHGQGKESDFPYTSGSTGRNGSCKSIPPVGKAPAYQMVPDGANKARLAACAMWKYHTAPWSTVSAGNNRDWNGDNAGLFTACNGRSTNHATTPVAYDFTGDGSKNSDYTFTVANSWDFSWGDRGFYHIKLGCDNFGEEIAYLPATPASPVPPPPPPPPPVKWTCTSKSGFILTHSYTATGTVEADTAKDALDACKIADGWFCRAAGCAQVTP